MQITTIIDTLPTLTANLVPEPHRPCPAPACASWVPVAITGIICATILIIAITGISLFFSWKNKEMKARKQAAAEKRAHEVENRKFESRAKLLEKLLSLKESRTKTENASKLDAGGCAAYEESLKDELKRFDDAPKNTENMTLHTEK